MSLLVPRGICYDESGLVTAVVQDRASGDVLMVAHANAEALALTAETGVAHFWSRSRGLLWKKGETSGNLMHVREIRLDCDGDCVLLIADPDGPACHKGSRTCFGDETATSAGILEELGNVIEERLRNPSGTSYTASLAKKGLDGILKKVGEEATEVVLAAKGETDERLAEEAADLLFHLMVALTARGVKASSVMEVLRSRRRPR